MLLACLFIYIILPSILHQTVLVSPSFSLSLFFIFLWLPLSQPLFIKRPQSKMLNFVRQYSFRFCPNPFLWSFDCIVFFRSNWLFCTWITANIFWSSFSNGQQNSFYLFYSNWMLKQITLVFLLNRFYIYRNVWEIVWMLQIDQSSYCQCDLLEMVFMCGLNRYNPWNVLNSRVARHSISFKILWKNVANALSITSPKRIPYSFSFYWSVMIMPIAWICCRSTKFSGKYAISKLNR